MASLMKKFTTLYNCEFSIVYTRREAAPKFRCDKFPKIKQGLKLKLKLGHRVTHKRPEQVLSKFVELSKGGLLFFLLELFIILTLGSSLITI